ASARSQPYRARCRPRRPSASINVAAQNSFVGATNHNRDFRMRGEEPWSFASLDGAKLGHYGGPAQITRRSEQRRSRILLPCVFGVMLSVAAHISSFSSDRRIVATFPWPSRAQPDPSRHWYGMLAFTHNISNSPIFPWVDWRVFGPSAVHSF